MGDYFNLVVGSLKVYCKQITAFDLYLKRIQRELLILSLKNALNKGVYFCTSRKLKFLSKYSGRFALGYDAHALTMEPSCLLVINKRGHERFGVV